MMTCQGCQERLFEYVYGLLDEPDIAVELQSHLAQCANCKTAHQNVLHQQKLLSRACRVETTIQFAAPKVEITKPVMLRTRSQVTTWYVSVASLLCALFLGIGGVYWWGQATKGEELALARQRFAELNQPAPDNEKTSLLAKQIEEQQKTIATLNRTLAELESRTQKELMAKTAYQQVFVPTSVPANNDAPVVVLNNLLNGQPAPISSLQFGMRAGGGRATQNFQYQNRQNLAASNKLNFTVPAVAYNQYAGSVISNEVLQDTQPLNNLQKITHPLEILKAEYAAHLCLDKPLYHPGEELFFRAIALDKTTFAACREPLQFQVKLVGPDQKVLSQWNKTAQLFDPVKQQLVRDFQGKPLQGVASGSFVLPESIPQGESQIILSEKNDRFPPQVTTFLVNSFTPPLFNKSLQFNKISYSPGEQVIVSGKVLTSQEQPLKEAVFESQISIDGESFNSSGHKSSERLTGKTDSSGNIHFAFTLPEKVSQGLGTVSIRFSGPLGTDTWTQPFRIETQQLQVYCYPEGGDLIAGTTNRVYFEMKNARGEPVDAEAELINSENRVVARLATFHDETESKASRGMGSFHFIPKNQDSYHLRLNRPAHQNATVNLPAVKTTGVVLHIEKSVLPAQSPIQLQISNQGKLRDLVVSVHCRGVLIALDQYRMAASTTQQLQIEPVSAPGGVYRVTISELSTDAETPRLIPLAERLIYRQPEKNLGLKLSTRQEPGKPLMLGIDAFNEARQPVPAYVTVVGVNKSLLQLADTSTRRSLPAHFLLAQEVRQPEELEHADFFISEHPQAPRALDLLLGVQGWRRFKEVNAPEIAARINAHNKMPILYFDNRQEMLDQVRVSAQNTVRQSSLPKELVSAQEQLAKWKKELELQTLLQQQTQQNHALSIKKAEQQKNLREREWNQFSTWFHVLSAGSLGLFSLIGLIAVLLKRAFLPWHLILTIGGLSLLGFAGTALLWSNQSESMPATILERVTPVDNRQDPSNKPEVKAGESVRTFKQAAEAPAPATGRDADENIAQLDAKHDRSVSLVSPPKTGKDIKSGEKGMTAKSGAIPAERRQEPAAALPAPGAAVDNPIVKSLPVQPDRAPAPKLESMRSASKEIESAKSPGKAQMTRQTKKMPTTSDHQSILLQDPKDKQAFAPGMAKPRGVDSLGEKSSMNRDLLPGGIGGLSRGNNTPPSVSKKDESLQSLEKKNGTQEFADSQMNEITSDHFFVRDYAWGQDSNTTKPGSTTVWAKTVLWKPFQIIPSQGRVELPVHLPDTEGVYHFEVFGFDGTGRIGATAIDIPVKAVASLAKPLTLETRLRQSEARVNDVIQLECHTQNTTSRVQPNIVVKIQIPQGLKLPDNFKQINAAIKASKPAGTVEPVRWNIKGTELTLEIPELGSQQTFKILLDLVCQETGEHTARPSMAYLENQMKDAVTASPLSIRIKPR